ncbi:MAG: FkbM family methyltransferase [Planctomycetes bacterium]|nr:FkbM family methyltransferase [Planctomycetota bacterium]
MNQYYRTIASTHFSDEPNIKLREELAEQLLVREFLGENAGIFVEVGANDPFDLSQTWHLARIGWNGILIEPIPALCVELANKRPESTVIEVACGAPDSQEEATFTIAKDSGKSTLSKEFLDKRSQVDEHITVKICTLDSILEDQNVHQIDFVSIDVEGTQNDVLRGFSLLKWKPRLLLIEDHLLDLKTHKLISNQGYKLVKRTCFNNWYIPEGSIKPKTGGGEDRILRGKLRRVPVRNLRFKIRRLLGKGL